MYGYVYITTNLTNGRKYIGQHRYSGPDIDPNYLGSGKILQQAIIKEGRNNFKCEILVKCNTQTELDEAEIFYIDKYDAVNSTEFYNIIPGGSGMRPGFKMPPDALIKMRQSHIGKTRIHKNNVGIMVNKEDIPEYLANGWKLGYRPEIHKKLNHGCLSGELNPMYGKHHSQRTKDKISEKAKGRIAWNKGIPNTYAKNSRWITNPITGQHRMVDQKEADQLVSSEGWRFGRN